MLLASKQFDKTFYKQFNMFFSCMISPLINEHLFYDVNCHIALGCRGT